MMLTFICNHCRHVNVLPFRASDRIELRQGYKASLENIVCSNCNKRNNIRINSVRARENKKINAILLIIGLISSLALAYLVMQKYWSEEIGISLNVVALIGGALALPQLIVGTIIQNNRKAAKIFNKHYV